RRSSDLICLYITSPNSGLSITTVVLSFSSLAFGCHATRYFPGWYLLYLTTPFSAYRVTCTLIGDIKIETISRLSLKYSGSYTSSITTTFPSTGARIVLSDDRITSRFGFRQNCKINNKNIKTATCSIFFNHYY